MEVETITQEVDAETRLQKAFERMIEIKRHRILLDAEEQLIKDDASEYLTGVPNTTPGRFVANNITADFYFSYRPEPEYDTEGLQKTKDLEEQLSTPKKAGTIVHQTPYLVVRILNGEPA